MNITITPSRLVGELYAISSKSHVHRLLLCAALADRPTEISFRGMSEDIDATIRCLEGIGCKIAVGPCSLSVMPLDRKALREAVTLDCGESGTAARLLLPVAAHLFSTFTLTGSGSLIGRPFGPLCNTLGLRGDTIPLTGGGGLAPGSFEIAGNVSSQFISGLLFALPLLNGDSEIVLTTPLESAGYVTMTLDTLNAFGVTAERTNWGFRVPGNQRYTSPGSIVAEGDWSNATFFLCMNALGANPANIEVRGLSETSAQGDRAIVELLGQLGTGKEIDASQINDLVPALAVTAALTEGETRISNAGRLRLKESDRIKTTVNLLKSLGGCAIETKDGLIIHGKKRLKGGTVDGAADHRIVMAAAVAACACENPVIIQGAEAVNKSYPAFFKDFKSLGGIADVVTVG